MANTWRNASIVFTAVVLVISMTSGHFENASTRTKYVLFRNGPAKSIIM